MNFRLWDLFLIVLFVVCYFQRSSLTFRETLCRLRILFHAICQHTMLTYQPSTLKDQMGQIPSVFSSLKLMKEGTPS